MKTLSSQGPFIAEKEDSQEHINRYVMAGELIKKEGAKSILDAACSYGYGSSILSHFADKVTAIDLDEEVIKKAIARYGTERITFSKGDVTKLDFPENSFDAAVAAEIIEHLDDDEQHVFLEELKRVIKPSGIIVITTPDKFVHKPKILKQEDHDNELTKANLSELLNEHFGNCTMYGQYVLRQAGPVGMFLKRSLLGIWKRAVRHPYGRQIGLEKLLDYTVYPLSEKQTAATITVVVRNTKKSQ